MSLTLQVGSPPASPVVTTNAAICELIVNYVAITGDETLSGILISATTPAVDDQDKVWLKTSAPIGLRYYSGGWLPLPLIIPSYTTALLPASPYVGQIVWNTDRTPLGSLEVYRAGAWTNNFVARGPTADRPSTRPNGFRYYDTDISRWIHWNSTASLWTTDDGCVGETRMLTGVGLDDALTRNPGWVEYTALADRAPVGYSATKVLGTTGGRDSFEWAASQREADQTGDSPFLFNVRIDGSNPTTLHGSNETADPFTDEFEVPIQNPYLAVLWIRKTTA